MGREFEMPNFHIEAIEQLNNSVEVKVGGAIESKEWAELRRWGSFLHCVNYESLKAERALFAAWS